MERSGEKACLRKFCNYDDWAQLEIERETRYYHRACFGLFLCAARCEDGESSLKHATEAGSVVELCQGCLVLAPAGKVRDVYFAGIGV